MLVRLKLDLQDLVLGFPESLCVRVNIWGGAPSYSAGDLEVCALGAGAVGWASGCKAGDESLWGHRCS